MTKVSEGTWKMSSAKKAAVKATGMLDGQLVDVSKLIWVEVEMGVWHCWFMHLTPWLPSRP